MADVTVKVLKNGPLLVSGPLSLQDAEGKPVAAKDPNSFALCRCGQSKSKPFCDGSHKTAGFQG